MHALLHNDGAGVGGCGLRKHQHAPDHCRACCAEPLRLPCDRLPQIGVIEDTENRDKLAKLLRFFSSRSEEDITSLDAYVSRMKPSQKNIYYMAADSVEVRGACAVCLHCVHGHTACLRHPNCVHVSWGVRAVCDACCRVFTSSCKHSVGRRCGSLV